MPAQAGDWHRDELVLVLNLYRSLDGRQPYDSELAELSCGLKEHGERMSGTQQSDFRSTSAISMMLGQFKALETRTLSKRGISLETEKVWDEFGRSVKQNSKRIWDAAAEIRGRWASETPDL